MVDQQNERLAFYVKTTDDDIFILTRYFILVQNLSLLESKLLTSF